MNNHVIVLLIDVEWFVVFTESMARKNDLVSLFRVVTSKVNDFHPTVVFARSEYFTDKGCSFGMKAIDPNVANFDFYGWWGVIERIVLHKQPRFRERNCSVLINVSRLDHSVKLFLLL